MEKRTSEYLFIYLLDETPSIPISPIIGANYLTHGDLGILPALENYIYFQNNVYISVQISVFCREGLF